MTDLPPEIYDLLIGFSLARSDTFCAKASEEAKALAYSCTLSTLYY
jgi:hypothetical protein